MKNSDKQEIVHNQFIKAVRRFEQHLNDLRLFIQYQTFDLEATRRENEHLKKLLEDQST